MLKTQKYGYTEGLLDLQCKDYAVNGGKMANAIFPPFTSDVNSKTAICNTSTPLAIPEISDLLETIKILLEYILSQREKFAQEKK